MGRSVCLGACGHASIAASYRHRTCKRIRYSVPGKGAAQALGLICLPAQEQRWVHLSRTLVLFSLLMDMGILRFEERRDCLS